MRNWSTARIMVSMICGAVVLMLVGAWLISVARRDGETTTDATVRQDPKRADKLDAVLSAARQRFAEEESRLIDAAKRACDEKRTAFFADVQGFDRAANGQEINRALMDYVSGAGHPPAKRVYGGTADLERECDAWAKSDSNEVESLLEMWRPVVDEGARLYRAALQHGDCPFTAGPEDAPALQGFTSRHDWIAKTWERLKLVQAFSGYSALPMDLRTMRLRYGDLRRVLCNHVGLLAAAVPSEYYNCRYGNHSRWRSFVVSDADDTNIHAYCRSGLAFCDALFEESIDAQSVGVAVLRYPEANSVCEEDQAELVGWNSAPEAIATIRGLRPENEER